MSSMPRLLLLLPLLGLLVGPAPASADLCSIWCTFPAISSQTASNSGIQSGSATINIKNAVSSSFLPDLNYIEDEDNGQDFSVNDPFFGIVTVVRRDQVLKIKTASHRIPVVLSFFDNTGSWIPFPAVLGSNKTISWPGIALPCIVYYSVSSPLTSAQVGMIVVVEPANDITNILIGAADGVHSDLCSAASTKAELALLDMTSGEGSGSSTIHVGESVSWYNSFDAATVVHLSDGRSIPVAGHGQTPPTLFDTAGVVTYTVEGHTGLGIIDVEGDVATHHDSFGALKARFGN